MRNRSIKVLGLAVLISMTVLTNANAVPTFLGPTSYLSQADSPFSTDITAGTTYLETFEDHLLDTPGVIASAGGVTSVVLVLQFTTLSMPMTGALMGRGCLAIHILVRLARLALCSLSTLQFLGVSRHRLELFGQMVQVIPYLKPLDPVVFLWGR